MNLRVKGVMGLMPSDGRFGEPRRLPGPGKSPGIGVGALDHRPVVTPYSLISHCTQLPGGRRGKGLLKSEDIYAYIGKLRKKLKLYAIIPLSPRFPYTERQVLNEWLRLFMG